MTESALEQLRTEWDAGTSTAAIGRLLGVSKNMIVGKAHRLGLQDRLMPLEFVRAAKPAPQPHVPPARTLPPLASESPVASAPTPPRPWPPLIDKPVAVTPRPVIAAPVPAPKPPPAYLPRSTECVWPIGAGRSIRWCDGQTVPGKPYCKTHCELAYETKGWRQRVGDAATMGGD
jgi:GcrA cell cycle regulator